MFDTFVASTRTTHLVNFPSRSNYHAACYWVMTGSLVLKAIKPTFSSRE